MRAIGNGICISLSLLPLVTSPLSAEQQGPNLLLAKTFKPDSNVKEFWVSEKLDGVRALWNGRHLITRGGHIVDAPEWFTQDLPEQALDGELWMGRGQFEKTSAVIRSLQAPAHEWQKIKFMVFDLPNSLKDFNARLAELKLLMVDINREHVELVEHFEVSSLKQLYQTLNTVEANGAEGLMLHKKDSLYQARRSYDLQKLKSYQDAEAKVIAHLPGNGKYEGMMGAIEVENSAGIRFKLGSGFSIEQRRSPPPIGSYVTYRYRGFTSRKTPRFATFLRAFQQH
ncbi:MAG: DNA ligase [Gammaproteobacteria bacterium]|nr:DNA ligase [Gammaproteobacteria bacterium]